jgi:hypothetical protein
VQGLHAGSIKVTPDPANPTIYYAEFTLKETLEQVDADEVPMEPGKAKFRARMDLTNAYGAGDMKMVLAAFVESLGASAKGLSNKDLLEQLKNPTECKLVSTNRKVKDNTYTSISQIVFE